MKEGKKLSTRKKKWIERTVKNDRSYKIVLYNRFFAFLLSLFIQLVFFVGLILSLLYDSKIAIVLQIVVFVLEICFILHLLSKIERASTRTVWILLIALLPAFGVLFYLLNATGRSTRKMKKKLQAAKAQNVEEWNALRGETEPVFSGERKDALSYQLSALGGYSAYHGGEVWYYSSGEEMYSEM